MANGTRWQMARDRGWHAIVDGDVIVHVIVEPAR
jgi:hypothetical protein